MKSYGKPTLRFEDVFLRFPASVGEADPADADAELIVILVGQDWERALDHCCRRLSCITVEG